MNKFLIILALVGGCSSENDLLGEVKSAGVPNARPVPVTSREDKLVQVQTPEVDILWIVDNSCSMSDQQAALALNFPVFMEFFIGSGLDYHIGSVSTDMQKATESGRLQPSQGFRFIDDQTPDPIGVFQDMAVLGLNGSGTEQGRDGAYTAIAINPDGVNDGYYREQASMHMVAISDEEDQSDDISLDEFIDWLDTLKVEEDMVTFSSIVSPDPVCPTAYTAGLNYSAVTEAIGGIDSSICDEDAWPQVLEQLGIQAAGLKREYFLSDLPVPGSIVVKVLEEGETFTFEEEIDWTYNDVRNSINFLEFVPLALSEVFVTYDLLAAQDNEF